MSQFVDEFTLSDELLAAALRVDDQPAPAALRGRVRAAVANVRPGRRFALPDLRIAFATALAIVAFAVVAVYVGTRPSVGPSETSPLATGPAVVITAGPTATDQTTAGPTPVATPEATPNAEPTPEAHALNFVEFAQHVAFMVNRFQGVSASHATVIEQGYDAGAALLEDAYLRDEWIRLEDGWIAEQAPATCFEPRFTAWADTVAAMTDQLLHGTGTAEELLAAWSPVREALVSFDTSIGLTDCVAPTGPQTFASHVHDSIAAFTPLADALDNGNGPGDLATNWLPTESAWIADNEPADCLAARWQQWIAAVNEAQAASEALTGQGTSQEATDRWRAARAAIESFDPTKGFDCTPPTPTPPPVAEPQPSETPIPEVASLADFEEHLAMQLEEFSQIAPSIDRAAAGPATGDAGELLRVWGDAYGLPRSWLGFERTWLSEFAADSCYASSRAAWETLVNDFEAFHQSISGYQPVIDATAWSEIKARMAEFDPTVGAHC